MSQEYEPDLPPEPTSVDGDSVAGLEAGASSTQQGAPTYQGPEKARTEEPLEIPMSIVHPGHRTKHPPKVVGRAAIASALDERDSYLDDVRIGLAAVVRPRLFVKVVKDGIAAVSGR